MEGEFAFSVNFGFKKSETADSFRALSAQQQLLNGSIVTTFFPCPLGERSECFDNLCL